MHIIIDQWCDIICGRLPRRDVIQGSVIIARQRVDTVTLQVFIMTALGPDVCDVMHDRLGAELVFAARARHSDVSTPPGDTQH